MEKRIIAVIQYMVLKTDAVDLSRIFLLYHWILCRRKLNLVSHLLIIYYCMYTNLLISSFELKFLHALRQTAEYFIIVQLLILLKQIKSWQLSSFLAASITSVGKM